MYWDPTWPITKTKEMEERNVPLFSSIVSLFKTSAKLCFLICFWRQKSVLWSFVLLNCVLVSVLLNHVGWDIEGWGCIVVREMKLVFMKTRKWDCQAMVLVFHWKIFFFKLGKPELKCEGLLTHSKLALHNSLFFFSLFVLSWFCFFVFFFNRSSAARQDTHSNFHLTFPTQFVSVLLLGGWPMEHQCTRGSSCWNIGLCFTFTDKIRESQVDEDGMASAEMPLFSSGTQVSPFYYLNVKNIPALYSCLLLVSSHIWCFHSFSPSLFSPFSPSLPFPLLHPSPLFPLGSILWTTEEASMWKFCVS